MFGCFAARFHGDEKMMSKNERARVLLLATVGILSAAVAIPAHATVLNWDADGVTPVNGGSGTWNTTNLRWEDSTNPGTYVNWNNATPDSAVFGGTAGTVNLGEAITAAAVSFNTANYILDLSGNNLTVTGATAGTAVNSAIVRNTGALATYDTLNIGNAAMRVTGALNLTLRSTWAPSNTNDFTGDLWFRPTLAGTLTATNNNQLGTATGLIKLDATSANAILATGIVTGFKTTTLTRDIQITQNGANVASFSTAGPNAVMLTGNISGGDAAGFGVRFNTSPSAQGHLILAGNNSYVGSTRMEGQQQMITLAHNNALGNSSGVTSGSTANSLGFLGGITLANTNTINIGSVTTLPASGYGNIHNLGGNNTASNNIIWANSTTKFFGAELGSTLTLNGQIGTATGTEVGGITKIGYGTVVFTAGNTYGISNGGNNSTIVNEGTLKLDFANSPVLTNIINNPTGADADQNLTSARSSNLIMGGGTLNVVGKAGTTNSQTFRDPSSSGVAGFVLNQGDSAIRASQTAGNPGTLTINPGRIRHADRAVGATLDFTLPTNGAIVLPATSTGIGASNTIITANGAAFATVDRNDWASLDGARNVVGGNSVGGFYTANAANTLSGNADMSSGADTQLLAPATPTSIRFNNSAARTIDVNGQTLSTGGILVTTGAGNNASTINNGTLRGNDNPDASTLRQDLVIINSNVSTANTQGVDDNTTRALTIGSTISNAANGVATGLTKVGDGEVILTAANTYTGETHINGGVLRLSGAWRRRDRNHRKTRPAKWRHPRPAERKHFYSYARIGCR
jgi:fibronectin-binding autotransporter adhesin